MDFLINQTRMNFLVNRMGNGFSWGSNGDFFLLPPSPLCFLAWLKNCGFRVREI